MLKIAHVTTAYTSTVTILATKLRALAAHDDLDVTVISSRPVGVEENLRPPVRCISLEMARQIKPLSDIRSAWRLYRILKRERYDVVHSHTAKAGFITALAATFAGVKLICHTYHGLPYFEGQNRRKKAVFRSLERIACRLRGLVFTQPRRDLPECIRLIGDSKRAFLEGNGVDIDSICRSAQRQSTQGSEAFPSGTVRLLLISRLEPVKCVSSFFIVIKKLRESGVPAFGVVAGAGDQKEELQQLLDEMNLTDCISLLGFCDYTHGLIAASDIVLLCSEKEGIPRAIMEAMALKKPVVATDVSGTNELVVDGHTGFLTPLGDTALMAYKVGFLIKNEETRALFGERGNERIALHFDDNKIANWLREVYHANFSKCMGRIDGTKQV